MPGGCAIGTRPIDLHLAGFQDLGAEVGLESGDVVARAPKRGRLRGGEVHFDKVTVTGTENLMMAAALAEGKTVLHNAAREPEIVDLAELLNKMGARVRGAGTPTIEIEGVEALGGAEHTIIPDRIETGTFHRRRRHHEWRVGNQRLQAGAFRDRHQQAARGRR